MEYFSWMNGRHPTLLIKITATGLAGKLVLNGKMQFYQNLDLMKLAGFCRNCLSKWYREEAQKNGIEVSDPDARKHVYGMPYDEWKKKFQK